MTTGLEVKITKAGTAKVLGGAGGYTVSEESTPVDPADTTGATGTISIPFFEGSTSPQRLKRYARATLDLNDPRYGKTSGIVRVPSGSGSSLNLNADITTSLLAVTRKAQPYNGNVSGYVAYLLSLVGITSGFAIDASFDSVPAVYPGWNDDVWLKLKQLAAAVRGEVDYVNNRIEFRPLRGRVASDYREQSVSWGVDDTQLAQAVEGYWYDTAYHESTLMYPPGGWSPDVRVENVDAGAVVEFEVALQASVSAVQQPVAVDFVSRTYNATSVYCVTGNDGLPIPAAQWRAAGGSLVVEIGEDTRTLVITVRGADIAQYSPFSIAATAGPSNKYSSLRIVGTGVTYTRNYLKLETGISPDITSREMGATVDDVFITSLSDLHDRMAWTLGRHAGARHSLTVTAMGIRRNGDSVPGYTTFDDFNTWAAAQGLVTFNDFNTWATSQGFVDFEDFNTWWANRASDLLDKQMIGLVAGSRVFRYGLWFRIRTAQIGLDGIQYTAENDTTVDDFNTFAAQSGLVTFNDFNTFYAQLTTFDDFNAAPLEVPEV